MPGLKPTRAPEYPRPVSPVCAEAIPICDDTVIYSAHADDLEEIEKQRAAKRRRIEANATSYLRGQPLFILTAGLRGPFDDEWQNPWTSKSTSKETTATTPRQQHSRWLNKSPGQAAIATPLSATEARRRDCADADADTPTAHEKQGALENIRLPESSTDQIEKTVGISDLGDQVQCKEHKVENWLRTSEAYGLPEYTRSNASPPSPSEGRKMTRMSPPQEKGRAAWEDPVLTTASDVLQHASSPKATELLTRSFSLPMQDRALPDEDEVRGFRSSPIKSKARRTPLQKRDSNALLPSTNESRAECAIQKSRRGNAQPNMAGRIPGFLLAAPDMHCKHTGASEPPQSGFRSRSPAMQDQMDVNTMADDHSGLNVASTSLQTAQEEPLSKNEELGPISLEKQTTDLPSAQIPEISILPSLPLNISSHDLMLYDSPRQEFMAPVPVNDSDDVTAADKHPGEPVHHASEQEVQLLTRPDQLDESHQLPRQQKDTEASVTLKTLPEGVLIKVRGVKKSADGASKGAQPMGVRKTSILRTWKRQAFTFDEKPSSSIKSALNVAKANAKNPETTVSSKASVVGGSGYQAHKVESHVALYGSPTTPRASPPKSILKAVTQQSMGAITSTTGSPSTERDAQKQQTLNPVDHDKDFDLDGAIDDLGSFLDTWDSEKQAAGVL